MLQEKFTKTTRAIKTFKELLKDRSMKNNRATMEFAQYWPEIESFLKDSKIVFEFEIYFPIGDAKENKGINLKDVKSSETNLFFFMREYFTKARNISAWRQIHEDVMNDDSVLDTEEFLNKFDTAYDIFVRYSFHTPEYGYEHTDETIIILRSSDVKTTFNYEYIKNVIGKVFNTDKIKINPLEDKRKYPSYWFIENDGSLKSKHKGYQPVEIVTPYLSVSEAPKLLEKFKQKIRDAYHCITDHSTGFHINITYKGQTFDKLKMVLLSNELQWLSKFDREFNDYCQSQYKYVIEQFKTLETTSFYEIINSVKIKEDKYTSFNFLKTNMIEFRGPGDDYLGSKFEHSQQVLDWFLFLMTIGLNKNFFRQEYLSKVMRLVNKYKPDTSDLSEPSNPMAKYIYRFVHFDHSMPMTMVYMMMSCYTPEVIDSLGTSLISKTDKLIFVNAGYSAAIPDDNQYKDKVYDMILFKGGIDLCAVLLHRMTNISFKEGQMMLKYALEFTSESNPEREEFKIFVNTFVKTLTQIKFKLELVE